MKYFVVDAFADKPFMYKTLSCCKRQSGALYAG